MWIYFYLKCIAACHISSVIPADPTSKQGQDMSIHRWEIVKQPLNGGRKRGWYLTALTSPAHLLRAFLCDTHLDPNLLTLATVQGTPRDISSCGRLKHRNCSTHPFSCPLRLPQVPPLTAALLTHTQLGKLLPQTDPATFQSGWGFSTKICFLNYLNQQASSRLKCCRRFIHSQSAVCNNREAGTPASQMECLSLPGIWVFMAREGSRSLQWDDVRLIFRQFNQL